VVLLAAGADLYSVQSNGAGFVSQLQTEEVVWLLSLSGFGADAE
jgi:hypothetical protein